MDRRELIDNKSEAGFTIFELLVVVFLLSVILTAVASNMARTVRVLWENRSRSIAVNMAQNCIEDFNYNNSWRDWTDFIKSDITQYCRFGMAGLCGGDGNMCAEEIVPSDILAQVPTGISEPIKLADPKPDESIEKPNTLQFIEANSRQPGRQMINRVYYDNKSTTAFWFAIKRYPAIVKYWEGVREVGSGSVQIREVEREREAMIVVVDVNWERVGADANDQNSYQVAKQYMAEKENQLEGEVRLRCFSWRAVSSGRVDCCCEHLLDE